jgi:hypothetical protein
MSRTTRRFALDNRGKKVYIGSAVLFRNKLFLVEDMQYLSWNKIQYLTLVDGKNKNKKVEFVTPEEVIITHRQ